MSRPDPADTAEALLHTRPAGPTLDHAQWSRKWFEAEVERADAAIKIIDLRMANTEGELARLRRQQVADARELEALGRSRRAAVRAVAEIDGVEP